MFVQCEVRHLGNTAYNMHTPKMSDKGLNLLLHSCCDLGLLYWQPVDFSDYKTAKDQEGTWAMNIAHAGQLRGMQAVLECVWASFALLEVWLCRTEVKGDIATNL